jgi:D-sedoheptulose 7-phosphate isomerase
MRSPREKTAERRIRERIRESLATKQRLLEDSGLIAMVGKVAAEISRALRRGHKVLLFGNGGSAADAQHIAAELVGRYLKERRALPAMALPSNVASLTAMANDHGFASIYARQIDAYGAAGDVAFAISTSGNSANVLEGVRRARRKGLLTVGLTGRRGGRLKRLVHYCLCIPSEETPHIQEAHILLGHILCELVENQL